MSTFSESVLRLYKRFISPQLPAQCRFIPSCSEYATEAVLQHGMLRGSALALWRLLRCNPCARGGFDPVPRRICSHAHMNLAAGE